MVQGQGPVRGRVGLVLAAEETLRHVRKQGGQDSALGNGGCLLRGEVASLSTALWTPHTSLVCPQSVRF